MRFILFLIGSVLLIPAKSIPVISLNEQVLQIPSNIATVWDLQSFFTSSEIHIGEIISYNITDESPCVIEESDTFFEESESYTNGYNIQSYDVINTDLYFLSGYKIYRFDIPNLGKRDLEIKKVIDIAPYNFSYMKVRKLPNDDIIFLLMSEDSELFYMGYNTTKGEQYSMQSIDIPFKAFNNHMKIGIYEEYIFIPAGRKGLFVYKYNKDTKVLDHVKNFDFVYDARDILLEAVNDKLMGIVADYNKGLITFNLHKTNMDPSNVIIHSQYSKVKSIALISQHGTTKIPMLIHISNKLTKYLTLTLNLDQQIKFSEEQSKLLNGWSNYVDKNNEYAIIIMNNYVTVIDTKNNISRNIEGVDHVRMEKLNEHMDRLIGIDGSKIVLMKMPSRKSILLCHEGEKNYTFTILGRSDKCRLVSGPDSEGYCDYSVHVKYLVKIVEVEQEEDTEDVKESYEGISGFAVLLLFLIIIPVTVIAIVFGRKYINENYGLKEYGEVGQEMEITHGTKVPSI